MGGDHLIGRLLLPHTSNTIFINFIARHSLIAEEDSGVERMFSVGRDGALQLIKEEMERWMTCSASSPQVPMEGGGLPRHDGGQGLP